jgi:hypothetical protein
MQFPLGIYKNCIILDRVFSMHRHYSQGDLRMKRLSTAILTLLLLISGSVNGQNDAHQLLFAPIENNEYKQVSSHEELLKFIGSIKDINTNVTAEIIGKTIRGKEIPMVRIFEVKSDLKQQKLNIFIFASQHGNEPSGKEALLLLIRDMVQGKYQEWLERINLILIPSVNPDGNDAATRQNGNGKDLNRSHLTLLEPESKAIHDLYARWKPEMTLDVHEFGAGGKSWTDLGVVRSIDEQFGAPTNLNISEAIRNYGTAKMFPVLKVNLDSQGIRFFNYSIMGNPGDSVRHSTTDINDGRQSFAILNNYSFILEGRNGKEFNDDLRRRVKGQYAAVTAFIQFGFDHAAEIRSLVHSEREKLPRNTDPVVLQMDHMPDGSKLGIPVRSLSDGKDSIVHLVYRPNVKSLLTVGRPAAYLIPQSQTSLIAFLDRHQIQYERLHKGTQGKVETSTIHAMNIKWLEGETVYDPEVEITVQERNFSEGDIRVPLDQPHSTMLVIALEPRSWWGLIQYEPFKDLRIPNVEYPIYRVLR